MPRIDAPTVAEHRAKVLERLVDAAEEILRQRDAELTAGAVTARAGIARNSIYRYVESVDDLRAHVVARYLPTWTATVDAAVAAAPTPADRIVTWVRVNLEQAHASGHGWLMEALRSADISTLAVEVVDLAHHSMRTVVADAWGDILGPGSPALPVAAGLTVGVVDSGFRLLDAGLPLEVVVEVTSQAVAGMVAALAPPTR